MNEPTADRSQHEIQELTPEARLDALVQVLAEGIIYLADNGQLEDFAAGKDTGGESGDMALTSGGNEGIPSCGARGAEDGKQTDGGGHGGR